MRAWLLLGIFGVLVLAIVVIRALDRDDGAPYNATTLSHSLERVVDGGSALDEDPIPCRRGRRFVYRCYVHDTSGSGGGPTYRVTATGEGCWEAVKVSRESEGRPFPKAASGCVNEDDRPD